MLFLDKLNSSLEHVLLVDFWNVPPRSRAKRKIKATWLRFKVFQDCGFILLVLVMEAGL